MTPESEDQRQLRANDLAFQQGKREAEVDNRLNGLEARLNAVNGSIEKHARNAAILSEKIDQIGDKIDRQETREDERNRLWRVANEKQISTRAFTLGVLAVFIPLMGLIITILAQGHA